MTLEGMISALTEIQKHGTSKDAIIKIFDADCGSFEEVTGFVHSDKEITMMSDSDEETKT